MQISELFATVTENPILSLELFQQGKLQKRRKKDMLEEYDIDELNPRPNPYAKELKKQITIKIAPAVIEYFKAESKDTGIPYQTLINMYLEDCVKKKKKLEIAWN